MVKHLGIRVAGAIVLIAYSAIDVALNAQGAFSLGPKWLPFITLIVFALLVFWIVYDLKKANDMLLDNRPSISVEIYEVLGDNNRYLRVHNHGAEGRFQAQIALSSKDPSVWCQPHYTGYWKYGNSGETTILKGQDDFLRIAELHSSHPPGPISQHLKIWFFDPSVNYAHGVATSVHWVGGTITSSDGLTTRPLTPHEYELEVIISSAPNLREGVFRGFYILEVGGLRVDSQPQSIPDKKDSRP